MSKTQIVFECQKCGAQFSRWQGKCNQCNSWNSVMETTISPVSIKQKIKNKAVSLDNISPVNLLRSKTKMPEFDRVIGGGIVPGMVILLGGDPGIGKSTISLQIANALAKQNKKVLYVTGEESLEQLHLRAQRLNTINTNIKILVETDFAQIMAQIKTEKPALVLIDSIQTTRWQQIGSAAGSVAQVRECTSQLTTLAKQLALPVILIGHITKEGLLAGPKVLEHIVDTVLYFEGEQNGEYRILRAIKNRFGPANEIGIFEMKAQGLIEVDNPTRIFLNEKTLEQPGSVVIATMEGSRPILAELQALVSPCNFGIPRRTSTGIDYNRLAIIIAVLEKIAGLHLSTQDIFINVTGGLKVYEPAADLGLALAIASSLLNKPLPQGIVAFGEVGLSGEIRPVSQSSIRLAEIQKRGFTQVASNFKTTPAEKIETINVSTIAQALDRLF